MKTILLAAVVITLAAGNIARSQLPVAPQTAAQKLEAIKAKNKELIERQKETLKKLEELQLEAQQIKFLGKRS